QNLESLRKRLSDRGQRSDQQPGGQQPNSRQTGGQQPGGQQPNGRQTGGQQPGGQQTGGQQPKGQQQPGAGPNKAGQRLNTQSDRNPAGGGPPRGYDRQLGSELRERLQEAEDIRRNLGKDRDLANNLDQAIQGLRRANDAITRDDMQTALLLKDQV